MLSLLLFRRFGFHFLHCLREFRRIAARRLRWLTPMLSSPEAPAPSDAVAASPLSSFTSFSAAFAARLSIAFGFLRCISALASFDVIVFAFCFQFSTSRLMIIFSASFSPLSPLRQRQAFADYY
jgi:hypothetical protein